MGKTGRAPTSGTRRGNGAGWGGPAKGSDPERKPDIMTHPPFEAGAPGPAGTIGERKARMQLKAYEVLETAMEDPDMRVAVTAADKALDRIEGRPMQKIVTPETGPDWFIAGVVEAEDMDEWQNQARLATARPAGNAD